MKRWGYIEKIDMRHGRLTMFMATSHIPPPSPQSPGPAKPIPRKKVRCLKETVLHEWDWGKRWSSPKGLGFGDTEAREGRGGNIDCESEVRMGWGSQRGPSHT